MKKSSIKLFLLCIIVLFFNYSYSQTFSFRAHSGYSLPIGNIGTPWTGGAVFGTSMDYYFNKNIGISLNFYYTKWSYEDTRPLPFWGPSGVIIGHEDINDELTRMPITTNIKFRIPTGDSYKQPFNIYTLIGGGIYLHKYYSSFSPQIGVVGAEILKNEGTSLYEKWGILGGLQFDFKINENIGFYIESKYNLIFNDNEPESNIDFIGGLVFYFGESDDYDDFF